MREGNRIDQAALRTIPRELISGGLCFGLTVEHPSILRFGRCVAGTVWPMVDAGLLVPDDLHARRLIVRDIRKNPRWFRSILLWVSKLPRRHGVRITLQSSLGLLSFQFQGSESVIIGVSAIPPGHARFDEFLIDVGPIS